MKPISTKAGGICVAFPDVCLVPTGSGPVPTPFINIAQCCDATGTVDAVLVENKEVIVESSVIPTSTGDEPGTLGGIISGTFMGCAKFKTASSKVYAKGKRVVLLGSVTGQNGDVANAVGQQVSPSQGRFLAGG
jgi:hypothetical protein